MTDPHSPEISIHAEIATKLNFAAYQSSFPLLRDLKIENTRSEKHLDNLTVKLRTDPSFAEEKTWKIDSIAPREMILIEDLDLAIKSEFLSNLTESARGSVSFQIEKDGLVLAETSKPIELLAYNEWGGAGFMPELLAAFSMPNDPSVDKIIRSASEILKRAGKEAQIDGYESRSRERVWEITSAIYTAIANLGLSYSVAPASFERNGQKIRLPSQILSGGVANCLDASMLFASALEQAGLNPMVALLEGHAMVGVWLQPEELSDVFIEEAETLRKSVDLKELLLIETTLVTTSPIPSFSKAVSTARETIGPDHDDTFIVAVDIHRARAHKITPLGMGTQRPEIKDGSAQAASQIEFERAPQLPDFDIVGLAEEEKPETPRGRLERWQRRLLDLSLRNPLLNHRSTKLSIQIICPSPGLLEDKLADGARIRIDPVPETLREDGKAAVPEQYAFEELEKNRVLVDLLKDDIDKRTVQIYRRTQTSLQEGGANTLYLALGFLLWKRSEKDSRRFRAPLILLPVTLERKSVRSGIRMLSHDDETRFNTTLLRMLHSDFSINIGGLDGELPQDQSGVDVNGVWDRIRREIKDVPGFEVVEDVCLGHFSFAKYLMWKDLVDRTDALRQNYVVQHLIDTPNTPFPSGISFVEPSRLDRDYEPSDLLTALPADSSQVSAIATAEKGKNFIIIGPPGTGKSQTIANMITHFLGKKKTVLFVSEKTAALEAVYRRLRNIGLGDFCLELHSNKAKKAEVLEQLQKTMDISCDSPGNWRQKADDLKRLRSSLNLFAEHLHMERRNGLTLYRAMGVSLRDRELAKRVSFSWPSAEYHDRTALEKMRRNVENLAVRAREIDGISSDVFDLVKKSEWSPRWEADVVQQAQKLSEAAADAEAARSALCEAIGIDLPGNSVARLEMLGEFAVLLTDSHKKQNACFVGTDGEGLIENLKEAVSSLKAYFEDESALSCPYKPFAWRELDGEEIERLWKEAEAAWWPKSFFSRRSVVKKMRLNGAEGTPDPSRDSKTLASLRVEGEAIDRLDNRLCEFESWSGHESKPEILEQLYRFGERTRAVIDSLVDGAQAPVRIRVDIETLLRDGNDLLAADAKVGRASGTFLRAVERLRKADGEFESLAGSSVLETVASSDHALEKVAKTAGTIARSRDELRAWCAWRESRNEAVKTDLTALVEAFERKHITVSDIEKTFEAAYCHWWTEAVIGEDEVLRTFSRAEHEAKIRKFCEIDDDFQKTTARYVAAELADSVSQRRDNKKSSQWGVLQREFQKKMRHKPIRQLIKEAPEAVSTLAPCFMMSPLSVAQYLSPEQALFDIVIFDEASQIPVWDAIGSIARGRQVVITGDPRQMPPTNFFNRSEDDPDGDIDTEGDLESILDEMLAAGIPDQGLNLHYRSRKEGLIAFSNKHYYENRLITFPDPNVSQSGVSIVRPDGFYARGGARHNEGEAKAIVENIVKRLTHEDPAVRELSIGVVTFNSEQQNLISNLLDVARSERPEIEWAFSDEQVIEPVFVKNLETVQGDERDVIMFSVTYGPDQGGYVSMNFGPLNREGGERRLNVALTRSRHEMIVFSTMHPDQINLSRTQARAVRDLKHFLEYAERGPRALGSQILGSQGDFESPFEAIVASELRTKGWQVIPQVGVSAYRIDLGVVHPDKPGCYLAGIECDGAMYHSSAFARERDKIRQSVLEGLGWKILRIWSTEWWLSKSRELIRIDNDLRHLLEQERQLQ